MIEKRFRIVINSGEGRRYDWGGKDRRLGRGYIAVYFQYVIFSVNLSC